MLTFGKANAKLKSLQPFVGKIYTFSLLSGHTCPFALDCYAKVIDTDGKRTVQDGPEMQFRCFSASNEALFPNVYNARKNNTDAIKSCGNNLQKLTEMLLENIPADANCIRIHVGGDFFTKNYFLAWCETAQLMRHVKFYAYTKALPFWVDAIRMRAIPFNMLLTASYGGRNDELIAQHNLRYARVVYSEDEANRLDLPIDHNDYHAAFPGGSFALLVHGQQPAGSQASLALSKMGGIGGVSSYGKKVRV